MVVIMNSWIVTVYPSAPWEPTCSMCHRLEISMVNSTYVSRKADDAYAVGAPDPCSQFFGSARVVHLLLFSVRVMFFVVCVCFLFLVFILGLYPFDFFMNLVFLDNSLVTGEKTSSFKCKTNWRTNPRYLKGTWQKNILKNCFCLIASVLLNKYEKKLFEVSVVSIWTTLRRK